MTIDDKIRDKKPPCIINKETAYYHLEKVIDINLLHVKKYDVLIAAKW